MALTFQVTIDCRQPRVLAEFWCAVLGYVIPAPPGAEQSPSNSAQAWSEWEAFLAKIGAPQQTWESRAAAEDPDGLGPRLFFQQVPEAKVTKNRVHLDVRAAPGLGGAERMAALEARCVELVSLGAARRRRVEPDLPREAGFIVMADPEGNEFCLD